MALMQAGRPLAWSASSTPARAAEDATTKPVLPAMLAALIGAAAMGFNAAVAAPIYATSLVAASNVTPFGSGIVTGPPDIGGLWLGSTFDPPALLGSLTVGFATPLADGPGIDLTVVDVGSAPWETFTVEVSSDNVAFTLLGEFSATNNAVDFSGLFAGPVRYVRLTNTSDEYSADIDTLFGNYAAPNPVPEPGTRALARELRPSLRRHPDRAVEPDHLAVQHRIFDDLPHERRELVRPPEPRRKRNHLAERLRDLGRDLADHRCLEYPGRDRHRADAVARELAGDRQRHADEPRLRCGVCRLADLAVECGDRCGEHDDAALAVDVRRAFRHHVGRKPRHVERADQVDVDRSREARERVRAFLADDLLAVNDPRAVDEAAQRHAVALRGRDGGAGARFIGDVGVSESRRRAELARKRLPLGILEVGDDHTSAGSDDHPRARRAESRCAAGHDECAVLNLHRIDLLLRGQ